MRKYLEQTTHDDLDEENVKVDVSTLLSSFTKSVDTQMIQFDSRLEKLESLLNRVLEIVQSKGKFFILMPLINST